MSGHVPVLLEEAVGALAVAPGGVYVDATFGRGGYARAILARGAGQVIAIDRDPDAISAARALAAETGRVRVVEGVFSALDAATGPAGADGVVFDLGVSSPQIDEAARGFSFQADGPLDMRMGRAGPTAADAVNRLGEAELAAVFRLYGEEREARRLARAIVADRAAAPFSTTGQLAGLCARVIGRRGDAIHPATRAFQGLRIFVNDELGEVARGLLAAERALKPDGRLAVVSFHSLEDRLVKRFLVERAGGGGEGSRHLPPAARPPATFRLLARKPAEPSGRETAANPRARSAKLRWAVRTAAPPGGAFHGATDGAPSLDLLRRAA